jgi:hypothetical protein
MRRGGSERPWHDGHGELLFLDGPVARPQTALATRVESSSTFVRRNLLKAGACCCHNQLLAERASWLQPR